MIYGLLIRTRFELGKPATVGNWLIRRKLPYDHAAVVFEENGEKIVAEMKLFGGYTETPFLEWIKQYDREIVWEPLTCTVEDIRKHKGKKYDKASAFWALPIYLLTGKWIGRVHIADRKLVCFEKYAILKNDPEFWLYMPGLKKTK